MENKAITNMSSEDVEKLTLDEKKEFEDFKQFIESYNQSLQNLISEKANFEHEINRKKSYSEASEKDIPRKVYLYEIVGPILFIGILSSYLILKIDVDVTQSYIKALILLSNLLIILCALFFPLLTLPKISWEN